MAFTLSSLEFESPFLGFAVISPTDRTEQEPTGFTADIYKGPDKQYNGKHSLPTAQQSNKTTQR